MPATTLPRARAAAPHTSWRQWIPCSAMMLCSFLSYYDRQVLAVVAPSLLRETGLTTEGYTQIVAAFSWTYMLANPLWGVILDRVGLRAGMIAAVALWTLASTAHAWAAGLASFALARAVLGLGEGAAFPGGLRVAHESLPMDRRSRGLALSYSGGSLGAILTPLLAVPVALHFGWRAAFLVTGVLGALWLLLWLWASRPPYLPAAPVRPAALVWPNLLERRCWALISVYSLGVFPIGVILYLVPLYLSRVFHFSQSGLGRVLWLPPLGWEVGYFFWAWLADRQSDQDRPLALFGLLAALSLPLGFVTLVPSPAGALALFTFGMFVAGGYIVLSLRWGARAYPPDRTAQVAGIAVGSWSLAMALLFPVLGRWFDAHAYGQTFAVAAVLPLLGTLFWAGFTARPTPGGR